jgi:hypothetical protein
VEETPVPQEISCQQVLIDETSVYSSQWMHIPDRHRSVVTPRFLFERYLVYLRKVTFSIVRPVDTGRMIEFRLAGAKCSLLSFSLPEECEDGHTLRMAICGGLLVQQDQCRRGQLSFVVEPEHAALKVMVHLADYCPLLLGGSHPSRVRRWLYRMTQALIHRKVTLSFLSYIYREIAGEKACVRHVRVRPATGRET